MSNKPQDKPADGAKKMTNYERKQEAKRKQAEREQRNKKLTLAAIVLACLCIIGVVLFTTISSALNRKSAQNDPYITIGEHEITKLEYSFYYNYTVNSYLNYLDSIGLLDYIGLDTSADFSKQQYTEQMTWKDAFDQMTVGQIQMTKVLLDDAKATGFVYDTTSDYESFKSSLESAAKEAGVSIKDYYKAMYGTYATEKNIKQYAVDGYVSGAYESELHELNKPTDDEITAYYEENKSDYDKVDYRIFTFTAEVSADASEDDISAIMAELKIKAETMKAQREAGEDFEALCTQYASEDDLANYEDEETEYSLLENYSKSSISSNYNDLLSDWLFEEARSNGNITVIEDTDDNSYYVVEFVQRLYDESSHDTISSKIADERVNEYLDAKIVNYNVVDIKGDMVYLTLDLEEETDEE